VFNTQFPRSLAEKPGRRDNAWQQAAERNFLRLVCVFSRGAHVQSPHAGAQTDLWWSLAASRLGMSAVIAGQKWYFGRRMRLRVSGRKRRSARISAAGGSVRPL